MTKFKKFRVWVGGSKLMDVEAPSKKAALDYVRSELGVEPGDAHIVEMLS